MVTEVTTNISIPPTYTFDQWFKDADRVIKEKLTLKIDRKYCDYTDYHKVIIRDINVVFSTMFRSALGVTDTTPQSIVLRNIIRTYPQLAGDVDVRLKNLIDKYRDNIGFGFSRGTIDDIFSIVSLDLLETIIVADPEHHVPVEYTVDLYTYSVPYRKLLDDTIITWDHLLAIRKFAIFNKKNENEILLSTVIDFNDYVDEDEALEIARNFDRHAELKALIPSGYRLLCQPLVHFDPYSDDGFTNDEITEINMHIEQLFIEKYFELKLGKIVSYYHHKGGSDYRYERFLGHPVTNSIDDELLRIQQINREGYDVNLSI